MALAPLADPAELARRLGVPADDPDLLGALAGASARFRDAVDHEVSFVEGDEITMDGSGTRHLYLPAFPVKVHTVTVDGAALEPADYQVSSRHGIVRRVFGCWPDAFDAVTITYDHGFEEVPDGIAEAVLDAAENAYAGTPGASSVQVGGESFSYGSGDPGGISEGWSAAVRRYGLGTRGRA